MFNNSHNIVITGPSTFTSIGAQTIDEGLKILYNYACPGAVHDSGERFQAPNCHPNTRVAVLREILAWLDEPESGSPVMWMNGAMGGGKSAIAQAIANICCERKQLLASFFFSRGNATRNDEKRLVATLAYQMQKQIPRTRSYISSAIVDDPLIFESSLKLQIEALITDPFSHAVTGGALPRKSYLIIIDGLDECINTNAQALIVKAFVTSILASRQPPYSLPLKLLLVSRPETNIQAAFCDPVISSYVEELHLNDRWLPADDIRRFLVDSFSHIKRSHPARAKLPANWPPISAVDRLVSTSSGQFVYAAVVIGFLGSHKVHPEKSLESILGTTTGVKGRPYEELDALYTHIFSSVDDLPLVLRILRLALLTTSRFYVSCSEIANILELPTGMLTVSLTNLVSILEPPEEGSEKIIFRHASLLEFLVDQPRAGELYVNSDEISADLGRRCISFMMNLELSDSLNDRFSCLNIFRRVADSSSADVRRLLCEDISNTNIMSNIEAIRLSEHILHHDAEAPSLFIKWIFAQHDNFSTQNVPNPLVNAIENIQGWILHQLKSFPFSGFDHPDEIDLWIFAKIYDSHRPYTLSEITATLSILTRSNWSEITNLISPSVEYCWLLVHSLSSDILASMDLGEYAMTTNRYLYAALRFFEVFLIRSSRERLPYPIFHTGNTVQRLLNKVPPSKDLYTILKKTMPDDASERWDVPTQFMPSQETRRVYSYIWEHFHRRIGDEYELQYLATRIVNYMDETRNAIPNIDSIVEEEMEYKQKKAKN